MRPCQRSTKSGEQAHEAAEADDLHAVLVEHALQRDVQT